MATLHTRADGTAPRWSGGEPAAFFRPPVPPVARQATDRGRGHSRAAFQSPSLRNVIHSPSADLLSDLQLGGAAAAPRWRLRASLVARDEVRRSSGPTPKTRSPR